MPLALLDEYIGRLDPQPGHGHALISRYFTRPLLDLLDIGVYTIGLRAEIAPTPRLQHLGLHNLMRMLPPLDGQALRAQAAAGTLTTLEGSAVVPVLLSLQGQARLGSGAASALPSAPIGDEPLYGSIHGSPSGSTDGSHNWSPEPGASPQQDGQNAAANTTSSLIAWDVGRVHESTKRDSTADHGLGAGGGVAPALRDCDALSKAPVSVQTRSDPLASGHDDDDLARMAPSLAAGVIAGHRALNPNRAILPGEWCEVLTLQDAYGVEQLLVWQARASRATRERPYGITPAYYHACAAQAAYAVYRPAGLGKMSAPMHPSMVQHGVPPPTALDPACDALLRTIGVRERQKLADVPYNLIAAWQSAVGHPGMVAQFSSPVGFAVAQMQRGNLPPSIVELDRWAERAQRRLDRYETWRHIDAAPIAVDAITQEQQLEARVRALASPDTDLAELCELARAIEAGATDTELLARLHTKREEERA